MTPLRFFLSSHPSSPHLSNQSLCFAIITNIIVPRRPIAKSPPRLFKMTTPVSTIGSPMTRPDPRWEALERAAHYVIRRLWLSQPDGGPFVTIVGEFARFKQLQGAMQVSYPTVVAH
jgi:hypothetical protein